MRLANQVSQLSLTLAPQLSNRSDHLVLWDNYLSFTVFSKYGHFFLQKTKMSMGKIQIHAFKTAVHNLMGDVTDITSIMYV